MALKQLENGMVVVDWETGDPEGYRKYMFQAYQDFIKDLLFASKTWPSECWILESILKKWEISINNQVDDFPRIWIKRPE
jgi:hypothetical protein